MRTLSLFLAPDTPCELVKVVFKDTSETLVSVRGKTSGPFVGSGTFQWTTAVRGMCALLVRARLHLTCPDCLPMLIGDRGSLASSLDYALAKKPAWLLDMFGLTPLGQARASRAFLVSNPNRKRPGPVAVSVNNGFLHPALISIYLGENQVESPLDLLRLCEELETSIGPACRMPLGRLEVS